MSDSIENEAEPRTDSIYPRPAVRHDGPEVRAKLTDDLYEALQREAASRRLSVAECVRQILQAHYDRAQGRAPELVRRLDAVATVLEQAQAERELLIAMVDLMYRGLLIRLERPAEEDVERRAADATEAYEKWRVALERQLDDGTMESLLGLVAHETGM